MHPHDTSIPPGGARHAPATARNREPIFAVLQRILPATGGELLEVASGTGEHAAALAPRLPGWRWHPTDLDPENLESIDAWAERAGGAVAPARALDVLRGPWPEGPFHAGFCANMIHISPWACTPALLSGMAARLQPGAPLVLYGPFHRGGAPTAPSNAAFDADLRRRDPAWGVRHLEAVLAEAERVGFALVELIEMPANNLCVALRAAGAQRPVAEKCW